MTALLRRTRLIGFFVSAGVGLAVLLIWWLGWFQSLEWKMFDARFKIRGPIPHMEDIVIISMDDASIEKIGRWPWERRVHARLIDRVSRAGVKAVAFDVFFSEKDTRDPGNDAALADATRRSRRVIHNSFFDSQTEKATLPLPSIRSVAAAVGTANVTPEIDGVLRKVPLRPKLSEDLPYPPLSLAIAQVFTGKSWGEIVQGLPVDENGEMLINWAGPYQVFPYIPYHYVLEAPMPELRALLKDKACIVGFTATGLYDKTPTPFSPILPGVEVHAHAINNYLNRNAMSEQPQWLTWVLVPLFFLSLGVVLPRLSPWASSGVAGGLLVAYFVAAQIAFSRFTYWIHSVPHIVTIGGSFVGVLLYRFVTEEREKRHIKKTFGQYVSPHVMEEILSDPAKLALGGSRKTLTVLFSDIRGFTTMSEGLKPEEVVAILNEYLSAMTTVVFKYEGTLDKFIGDAVMAFWGAPIPQADHARRAVNCALEMMDVLAGLQEKWRSEGKHVIDIGIGVNTGDMIIGNMGSVARMDYTVIGDNVNLASRLESANKEFKTHIIISEATYEGVKDLITARPLGDVNVKGKKQAVRIYEVVSRRTDGAAPGAVGGPAPKPDVAPAA